MKKVSVKEFLLELKAKDIKIWLDGERLCVNAAKDAVTPELRDKMSSRKQDIVDFLKVAASVPESSVPEIIPIVNDGTPAPLSFGQQRSWLLHELNKEQEIPYDTLTINLTMHGQLNIEAIQFALFQVIKRHDILRSVVGFHNDQPVQNIIDVEKLQLERLYFSDTQNTDSNDYIRQVIRAAKETLFDLSVGPLFKMQLVKLSDKDHMLILIIHHMVFDAWSKPILIREIMQAYQNFQQGIKSDLPALSLQYSDFSRWQRQWLQGEKLEKYLNYWKQQLDGIATLDLPVDKQRPLIQTYHGKDQGLQLSADLSGKLFNLARNSDVSMFMLMLSALGLLLSRYSGQTDIAIGTPITSRDRTELQDLIGYFLNTLVMRLDYSGDANFLELLGRCRNTCLGAFAHQHLPFEKLVEELDIKRDQSSTPLFQVLFVLIDEPGSKPLTLEGVQLSSIQDSANTASFDLEVYVTEGVEQLGIGFVYNTDLFNDKTISSMLKNFTTLLESIIEQPEQKAFSLELLDSKEKSFLLSEYNQTKRPYNLQSTLPQLFEAQVDKTPDNIALIFEGESLTYLELDKRANQLANYLHERRIGVGDYVAVFMLRSLELVIALYAIHKSGAAYVPLDPEYPGDRLSWMIEDTQTPLILTQSGLLNRLPDNNAKVISLNGDHWNQNISQYSDSRSPLSASSDDAAYVIYTSGSTGKPKGVVNLHNAVVNLLEWMQETYSLTANDCDLQKTPFSFDVSVLELFWPLVNGSRLVIARPDGHKDPLYISSIVRENDITTLHFVPSMLRAFLDTESMKDITTLKRVICIGEALTYELEQQFFNQSSAQLLNLYGPTEAAVIVSHWTCKRDDERKVVPIGFPIANTSLYILDSHLQVVPTGVHGELHIGGIQVAKEYLNREQLTAEKFIADPYSTDTNARLYKTGDRARHLPDGSIEFLGRIDNQVKLRGFRIELGEIEAILINHNRISRAVVMVREDRPGDQRLVAYVIPSPEIQIDQAVAITESILDYLKQFLPVYMVPSSIEWINSFPETSNGKISYALFPCPAKVQKKPNKTVNHVKSELEIIMIKIWEDLLELDDIETNDMFFDLGGHSLLTLKVVDRFEKETNIRIPPTRLMNQTLRQLVATAETSKKVTNSNSKNSVLGSIKRSILKRG